MRFVFSKCFNFFCLLFFLFVILIFIWTRIKYWSICKFVTAGQPGLLVAWRGLQTYVIVAAALILSKDISGRFNSFQTYSSHIVLIFFDVQRHRYEISLSSHVGSDIVPVDRVGRISYGHCLHHASPFWSITCILFHQSIFLLILYFFHIYFGLLLLPLTSNFEAFTITFSSFLKIWPYHRILLALAILSKDCFVPNVSINSSLFLWSNSSTPLIARIVALSVFKNKSRNMQRQL